MSKLSLSSRRWKELTRQVKERDGWRCIQCGTDQDLTVDHVKPLDKFTTEEWEREQQFDPDMLATLCRPCNSRKGNRDRVRTAWFNPRWLSEI